MIETDVIFRHYTDSDAVRATLVDLYAEVYAEHLSDPFHSIESFSERLVNHVTGLNWEAVIGYKSDEPIGYVYGTTLRSTTNWWTKLDPPPDAELGYEDGTRTIAIFELMVRAPWRKTGLAWALHEELVVKRPESRVTLSVDHDHPRVRALYEAWGYRFVASHRPPFPGAPLLDIMLREADQS